MVKKYLFYFLIPALFLLFASCNEQPKPALVTAPIAKQPTVMQPFRFHKLIEVSPGQDYDVLSWGRGSSTIGSFVILHSDSSATKYTTTTGDLDGAIIDVYNADMDLDGNPEILIQTKGKDTTNYTTIYAFEFTNGKAQKLEFPKLTKSQKQGYRGGDNFYIKDGKFIREFNIYDGSGTDAKTTGQKRQLEYGLRNNSFTVKQLSKDSTDVTKTKVKMEIKEPVKTIVAEKKHTEAKTIKKHTEEKKSHKEKKKRQEEKKHKKKKHRRHRESDEGEG